MRRHWYLQDPKPYWATYADSHHCGRCELADNNAVKYSRMVAGSFRTELFCNSPFSIFKMIPKSFKHPYLSEFTAIPETLLDQMGKT